MFVFAKCSGCAGGATFSQAITARMQTSWLNRGALSKIRSLFNAFVEYRNSCIEFG